MPLRHLRPLATLALAAAAGACTEIGAPDGPTAISVTPLPRPAVVRGDSLRDTTGMVVQLSALVLDEEGNPVVGAPVEFTSTDPTRFEVVDGVFVRGLEADTVGGTPARIVASIGGLQATQPLIVALPPLQVARAAGVPEADTIEFRASTSTVDSAAAFGVRVTSTADSAVYGWLVSYAIEHAGERLPLDDPAAVIRGDNSRGSPLDTTDATGLASRRVHVDRRGFFDRPGWGDGEQEDSLVVFATVRNSLGEEISGSPVRYVVRILPRGFTTSPALLRDPERP